jgi:hypothetical protein
MNSKGKKVAILSGMVVALPVLQLATASPAAAVCNSNVTILGYSAAFTSSESGTFVNQSPNIATMSYTTTSSKTVSATVGGAVSGEVGMVIQKVKVEVNASASTSATVTRGWTATATVSPHKTGTLTAGVGRVVGYYRYTRDCTGDGSTAYNGAFDIPTGKAWQYSEK